MIRRLKYHFPFMEMIFWRYFDEHKKIVRELGTELETLYGAYKRMDKLILVDDESWMYNLIKSAETGKTLDSFIICFADLDDCDESLNVGRSVVFMLIIKYLQKMGLHKKLSIIENKVTQH